jgi:hypothetical protein
MKLVNKCLIGLLFVFLLGVLIAASKINNNGLYFGLPSDSTTVKELRLGQAGYYGALKITPSESILRWSQDGGSTFNVMGTVAAWKTGVAYIVGDVVVDSLTNILYRCNTGHTSGASLDETKFDALSGGGGIDKWVSATAYDVDDVVWLEADNKLYRCITGNSDVTFTAGNWTELSSGVTLHNSLSSLQGGTSGEYFHLTDAQATVVTRAAADYQSGYATADQVRKLSRVDSSLAGENILANNSFESLDSVGTGFQDWTIVSSATVAQVAHATDNIAGNKYFARIESGASGHGLKQTPSGGWPSAINGQCLAEVKYKDGDSSFEFQLTDGSSTLSSMALDGDTADWSTAQMAFACPTAASTVIAQIVSDTTGSHTIDVDRVFVGRPPSLPQVAQATEWAAVTWVPTTDCVWSGTSGNFVFPAFDAQCDDNARAHRGNSVALAADDGQLPAIRMNTPAGNYMFSVGGELLAQDTGSVAADGAFRICDSTETYCSNAEAVHVAGNAAPVAHLVFTVPVTTNLGDTVWKIQLKKLLSGTEYVFIDVTRVNFQIVAYRFPPTSSVITSDPQKIVYGTYTVSSSCQIALGSGTDADWTAIGTDTDCVFPTQNGISQTGSGLHSWTYSFSKTGRYLVQFSSLYAANEVASQSFKLFGCSGSSACTSASTGMLVANSAMFGNALTDYIYFTPGPFGILDVTSTGNWTITLLEKTVATATAHYLFSSNSTNSIATLVISPLEVGQTIALDTVVKTPGVASPKIYAFARATNGVVSGEVGDVINGDCTNASPSVCTFNSGIFTATPVCTCITSSARQVCTLDSISSSSAAFVINQDDGSSTTTSVSSKHICFGY